MRDAVGRCPVVANDQRVSKSAVGRNGSHWLGAKKESLEEEGVMGTCNVCRLGALEYATRNSCNV